MTEDQIATDFYIKFQTVCQRERDDTLPGDVANWVRGLRPQTPNADAWLLFLEEHKDAGPFVAVQIAEAIEAAQALHPIRLHRSGDYAIVSIEIDGKWAEIIRERVDGEFCHIVEPSGIAQCVKQAA